MNALLLLKIWKKLGEYLDEYGFELKNDPKSIILNNGNEAHIVNFIILVVKQFIFRCKCNNKKPNWQMVLDEINLLYKIELHNALLDRTLVKHLEKWKYIKPNCMYQISL